MPAGTPYGRTALPTKVVDSADYVGLAERMSQDYFRLGADHRAEADAQSLASLIQVPESGGVTGTTGYEGMLQPEQDTPPATPVSDAGGFGDTSVGAAASVTSATQRRTPLQAMPEAPPLPQRSTRQPVTDAAGQAEFTLSEPASRRELPGSEGSADVSFTAQTGGGGGATAIPYAGGTGPGGSTAAPPIAGKDPAKQAQVYQRARLSGLDDEGARVLVAVTETEGGLRGARGDQGRAAGAYQFHTGGEMPGFAAWVRKQGIPGDPNVLVDDVDLTTRYAAEGYLGQAIARGRELGYRGADLATYVQRTGQRSVSPETTGANYTRLFGSGATSAPLAAPAPAQAASEGRAQSGETRQGAGLQGSTPAQFGLGDADADAICGPVLAMAFARSNGRNPTIDEAKQMAAQHGRWTSADGMGGPEAMAQTLRAMNIPAHYAPGALDLATIRTETTNGNPVGISTPGHYFVVEGVDADGRLDLGNSAKALRASGGRQWFRPDEIAGLGMGAPTGVIYKDAPSSPTPSVAVSHTNLPAVAHPEARQAMAPEQRREHDAMSLAALSDPSTGAEDLRMAQAPTQGYSDVSFGMGDTAPAPAGPPARDDYRNEVVQPLDPDQGPRELGYSLPPAAAPAAQPSVLQGIGQGLWDAGAGAVGAVQGAVTGAAGAVSDAAGRAVGAVQDAYAVPTEQRPPQYSGPSYAQPTVPEGQRPYVAPTETESAAVSTGLQHAAAAEPIERLPIPFTSASVPIPGLLQRPAGFVVGGAEALNAADQAVRARIDPRVWEFARDGIRRELFSPEQLARDAYLRGAMDPETGRRHVQLSPAEQDELAAMDQAVEQRYQQIKDDPDALTQYANASPAYGATSAITDIALTPALGAAAGGAATRGAAALGASARAARGIGYAADIAAQTVVDPTTPLTQGPLDAAVAGARRAVGAARALPGQVGAALADNPQRMAAADARMAAEGSTAAPGVFGLSGIEPGRPEVQGMRPRIIPEDVADTLDYPIKLPEDPAVIRAIEAAGGTVDERGTTLNVIRHQDPEAAGGAATRSMTFYTAGPPGAPSEYARTGTVGPQGVGGQQRIEGRTRFRNPLFISDAPGEPAGFDDAVRQLDIRTAPLGTEADIAAAQARADAARAAWQQARAENVGAPYGTLSAERLAEIELATASDELQRLRGGESIKEYQVRAGIDRAKRAGPAGSAERAQALKDLVTRYGGDPDVIDELIALRGVDKGESVYAVKENIVAGNARRAGHDGVITLKEKAPDYQAIAAHPEVAAAQQRAREAGMRSGMAEKALREYEDSIEGRGGRYVPPSQDPERRPLVAAAQQARDEMHAAGQAAREVEARVRAELGGREITELADPREGRNPTPGAPNPRIVEARRAFDEAYAEEQRVTEQFNQWHRDWQDANHGADRRAYFKDPEAQRLSEAIGEAQQRADALREQYRAIADAESPHVGPPGYTLRPDIPRRAARLPEGFTVEQLDDGSGRWVLENAAGDWLHERTFDRAAEAQAYGEAQGAAPTRGPGSEIAQASAGALAPSTARRDPFAIATRAISEPLAGSIGGATIGGGLPAETDEERRANTLRGAAIGAVGFPAATRLARGAARMAGRGADVGGGARIALGDVPPSKVGQQGLPEIDHPPYTKPDLPAISDQPNAPGNRLGNVPPSQVREPVLPGMEPPPAPSLAELAQQLSLTPEQQTALARLTGAPAPSAAQGMREGLPGMLRDLGRPADAGATEGASLPLPGVVQAPTGAWGQVAARLQQLGHLADPVTRRVQIVRLAGMLSDTAGQALNVAGNVGLAGRDLATAPLMLGMDMARSAATGRPREVFAAELGARMHGMRVGARLGVDDALSILRSGVPADEASKLDSATGFGMNIPGLAPAGSRRAAVANASVEWPLRTLGAADAIFRTMAQGGHLMAEATAAAMKANGGRAVTEQQIRAAAQNPELLDRVQQLAKRSVLQEDRAVPTAVRKALSEMGLLGQLASTELPFVKTPYNVVAQGMEMSPAGLAGVLKGTVDGSAPRVQQRRLAEVMLGTSAMAIAANQYAHGQLTGPYPEDAAERSTLPPGWKPWSYKVDVPGAGTIYLPFEAIAGPLALPAVMTITALEAQKKSGTPLLSGAMAGKLAAGVGSYLGEKTFFDGFMNLAKLVDNPEARAGQHLEGLVAQYGPHVFGFGAAGREVQRVMGMPARDPDGWAQALLAQNPLTAGRVAPKQDVLGRPESMGLSGPAALVARAGVERDHPVIRAYRRGGVSLPTAGPKTVTDPGTQETISLTVRQRAQWERAFGEAIQQRWDETGNDDDPQALARAKRSAAEDARRAVLGG